MVFLGLETQGGKMVGAEESTELRRHPQSLVSHDQCDQIGRYFGLWATF